MRQIDHPTSVRTKSKAAAGRRHQLYARRGAVALLVAFIIPMLLILSAYAINSASLELYQTEMYCAADAAARAGIREFAGSRDEASANAKAKEFARANTVAGQPLLLADQNIIYGTSMRSSVDSRYEFSPAGVNINSLKVIADRSAGSPNGPLPVFMSNLLNRSSVDFKKASVATQVVVDIGLVIDRSGSMAYAIDEPAIYPPVPASAPAGWDFGQPAPPESRWRSLVTSVSVFNSEVRRLGLGAQIAMATYNDLASVDQTLTFETESVMRALQVYTDSFNLGGTNIGGGIRAGTAAITSGPHVRAEAVKVLIVMSDGLHNVGTDPKLAATEAANGNVMIFTISFSNEAEQSTMRQIAAIGGGEHFHANSLSDLTEAYRSIARKLPTLLTQ